MLELLSTLNTTSENYIDVNYVKNLAYQFILKENITSLPVSASHILSKRNYFFRNYDKTVDFGITPEYLCKRYGNALVFPGNARYPFFVWLNMNCNGIACDGIDYNWATMQMLAHIELGHLKTSKTILGDIFYYSPEERFAINEAALFSSFVLSPDIILKKIGLRDIGRIHSLCRIPYYDATQRIKYFSGLDMKFLSGLPMSVTEQKVCRNFRNFIKEYNENFKFEFATEFA